MIELLGYVILLLLMAGLLISARTLLKEEIILTNTLRELYIEPYNEELDD